MFKKIALLVLCALPFSLMAQEVKLGHINSQEILSLMPERTTIEKTISDLQAQWEKEIAKMREEYFAKTKEYQEKQATMPESIKQARQSEIAEMEQRISTTGQNAQTDLQKKSQDLFAPVIEKVKKAINEVGAENGYLYIFDLGAQSIIYQSPKSNDVTALVKKKLALK
ncbi:outer membrane chaperone Skp (OmpH) [Paludibacter propionicigenes WB4]|uniref:Outer membrane chaperone Skp (OmpH) n=1 Tax=Paludibacter propionicigenes (strain DSM 17365 / JCM 13257 / WB4) TaxID=694427 RepID=E4T4E8_PALPW|nr:OmpH family outer membrane protein [Paludibacter propionicigenes]ADQ79592.1 outer membrane chaperone Skp (OmpH) [Paludibacter propionicigenes WB4]